MNNLSEMFQQKNFPEFVHNIFANNHIISFYNSISQQYSGYSYTFKPSSLIISSIEKTEWKFDTYFQRSIYTYESNFVLYHEGLKVENISMIISVSN